MKKDTMYTFRYHLHFSAALEDIPYTTAYTPNEDFCQPWYLFIATGVLAVGLKLTFH